MENIMKEEEATNTYDIADLLIYNLAPQPNSEARARNCVTHVRK